jgi:hypothetical protein
MLRPVTPPQRSRVSALLVAASLWVVAGWVTASPASACSCVGVPEPAELVKRASLVYVADLELRDRGERRVEYDARVLELPEGRYLVAELAEGSVGGVCSWSTRVSSPDDSRLKAVRVALGRPAVGPTTPPDPAPSGEGQPYASAPEALGPGAWLPLLGLLAVLGAVVLVARRRRPTDPDAD